MSDSKKMPPPPKRPLCSFFQYKKDVYAKVKKDNPTKSMTQLTVLVSEMYNKMNKDKKEEYDK